MKTRIMKIVVAFFLLLPAALHSQSKWFFSVSSGVGFGGPLGSIRSNMVNSGLNQRSNGFNLFGITVGSGIQYPTHNRDLPLLLKLGKKIGEGRSVYLEAGVSSRGEVAGYQQQGTSGVTVRVRFSVLQFTTGYQWSFTKNSLKLGAGPSLYLFRYADGYKHQPHNTYSSLVPGISAMARLPFGKERRLVGLEMVAGFNVVPSANMQEIRKTSTLSSPPATATLKQTRVSMIHGMVGLALSFR